MRAYLLFTLILSASLLALHAPAVQAQYYQPRVYVEPSYSGLTAGYIQASFDDYRENASDINFRFEQRLHNNLFISALYHDFSEPVAGHSIPVELEDKQIGIGYLERSAVGPHVDASVLVGRETFQRPATENADDTIIDDSNYFGLQIGLREAHGIVEAQAGIAYILHDGQRNDQLRWHVGAFLTIWNNLAVGLRYQDNDDYSLRSVELRLSW